MLHNVALYVARVTQEQTAEILARLRLGETAVSIAADLGIVRQTVARIAKKNVEAATPEPARAPSELAREIVEEVKDDIRPKLTKLLHLSIDNLIDYHSGERELDDSLLESCWRCIDKVAPSADAKEASKTAAANAESYAAMLARLTATSEEKKQRMLSIRDAYHEVVNARMPYIVNPPDTAAS